ncbi:MAG: Holliday junction resolvase RuvX [Micropruina sp.]|nr:Holliday junction resolvase RuvX [Micropruina sp.]
MAEQVDSAGFRPGIRLALDWGQARIGVAACDRDGLLAYPVETIPARGDVVGRLRVLLAEYEPLEVIVGLPRTLAGVEGFSATLVRDQLTALGAHQWVVPVRLLDERMSTVTASRRLTVAGKSAKSQRGIIDQAAAVAILEQAIASERASGRPAGEPLSTNDESKRGDGDG